ncbi:uracil-DNA glycosylase [Novosphingobium sp. BL-8A]|uniref:uracil-DNA glycosylase n=1 Tax=Novosphingobium sp. BL-8A TaxID=3127639 RepID=UPI00375680EC
MIVDEPYANDSVQSAFRRSLLREPHMLQLTEYVEHLRHIYPEDDVPDFDPAGGGTDARVLVLLEKPSFVAGAGSRLISPHNRDPTAKHLWEHMNNNGLARNLFVHWNIVPTWNGTMKITAAEERRGAAHLNELLKLLPNVRAAVLCGAKAQRAGQKWADHGISIFKTAHPGMQARNGPHSRENWKQIGAVLSQAVLSVNG